MKVNVLGAMIDNVTMDEAVERAMTFFEDGKTHYVFTPNPEIIMEAQNNDFMDVLNSADMLLPDGIGVVIGAKLLKTPLKERVAGFDFTSNLLTKGKTFYLFGGKPGVAEEAAKKISEKGVKVVGTHDGYFKDDKPIIDDINEKKPDILLVCLGAPKQENWIYKNRDNLNVSLCIGAGGSIDVFAGTAKRAPDIFVKLNLEWFYRLLKQPSRLPRMMKLPRFLLKIVFGGNKK